ncbi:MAG: hypothetical protein MZW92_47315 [Comamonadaceae bacterium]|nr:hypothetical protein [Comamonadaceae bacterium]
MKAAVAAMSPAERRATAFGTFNLSFGLFWFAGSALMGWLYGVSLMWLVVFSITVQLLAVGLLTLVVRAAPKEMERIII